MVIMKSDNGGHDEKHHGGHHKARNRIPIWSISLEGTKPICLEIFWEHCMPIFTATLWTMANIQKLKSLDGWMDEQNVNVCICPLSLTVIPTFNRKAVMTSEALRIEPVDFPHRRRKGGSGNGPWALRWALGHFFLYVLPRQLFRVPVFGVSKVYTTCKVWKWEYPSLHIWGCCHPCWGNIFEVTLLLWRSPMIL